MSRTRGEPDGVPGAAGATLEGHPPGGAKYCLSKTQAVFLESKLFDPFPTPSS